MMQQRVKAAMSGGNTSSHSVLVAMSGGVDSAVAAALLKEQGCDVVGATMKLFSNENVGLDTTSRTRCSLDDVEVARRVAYKLGIDHHVFNFGDDFSRDVIARFAEAYREGRTPNPCIDCNRFIKFDKLFERGLLLGLDFIATGHYARIVFDEDRGRWLLLKSADASKDQTYVLAMLTQAQLSRTLLPLGGLTKTAVRALAEERGLANAGKPDSQDICFVPDGNYASFLENVLGIYNAPGSFVDTGGKVLGTHKGILHYTIGQRRGLGLSSDKPKYVVRKDAASNTVVVGDEAELYTSSMTVEDVNLIAVAELTAPTAAAVKTRYSQSETPATLYPPENGRMRVEFAQPQRAVTPGQAAVFYNGDIVLGGGTIV